MKPYHRHDGGHGGRCASRGVGRATSRWPNGGARRRRPDDGRAGARSGRPRTRTMLCFVTCPICADRARQRRCRTQRGGAGELVGARGLLTSIASRVGRPDAAPQTWACRSPSAPPRRLSPDGAWGTGIGRINKWRRIGEAMTSSHLMCCRHGCAVAAAARRSHGHSPARSEPNELCLRQHAVAAATAGTGVERRGLRR